LDVEVSRSPRIPVFIAVLAIHLVTVAALLEAMRERKRFSTDEGVVSALIYLPQTTPKVATPGRAPSVHRAPNTAPASIQTLPPALQQLPNTLPQKEELIDWAAAAHQAARDLLAAEASERERNSKMGTGWWLAQDAKHRRRAAASSYPWSHQPLSSWVDIDPDSFVISFTLNQRCQLVMFLFVAGFGCALGHLDPEPGRADLFDPKYRTAPLEQLELNPDDAPDK
jgi:hypothetical protein